MRVTHIGTYNDYPLILMSRTRSHDDFDHFDDWEDYTDDDGFILETQSIDDWEDDGAIAEVRDPISRIEQVDNLEIVEENNTEINAVDEAAINAEIDVESAEVFSLIERAQAKKTAGLLNISEPTEDELSEIEQVGIDDYIDIVLSEEEGSNNISEEEAITEDHDKDETEPELVVQSIFEGVAACVPTLFDEDGEVEYKTTARLVKRLEDYDLAAVFVATKDGEGETLSRKERKKLTKEISSKATSPVYVDISAPCIRQSVALAQDAADAGANGFLLRFDSKVKDPYGLCEAIYDQYRDCPIFVQLDTQPGLLPISPEFLYDLPIAGVIDATGDISFFMHLMSAYSGPVYIGSTSMIATGYLMGATGVVLSHAVLNNELVTQAFAGDAAAQSELCAWERETGVNNARAIKLALESEFLISSTMRD